MVLRAKKAQTTSMRKALLELLVFSIFFVVFISILSSLWTNLKGTSLEEQAEMQFNVFVSNLKVMSYTQSEYSLSYSQLLMPAGYYLVAFPGAAGSVYFNDSGKIKEISRPKDCSKEPEQTCLCLYDEKPISGSENKHKNVVVCKHIPVKMLVANHIYEKNINVPMSESYSFSKSGTGFFLGGRFVNKSAFGLRIRELIEGAEALNINDRTQYLGFYDKTIGDIPLHDLVIKSNQAVPIPLYIELLKSDDKPVMAVFPYSHALFNRKYFLSKYPGPGSCDNRFLHSISEVIGDPGVLSYCEQTINGLIESENRIGFCPQGELSEMCACGGGTDKSYSRAITSGYCAKFGDIASTTLVNLPPDYCKGVHGVTLTSCSIYENKYACASNACGVVQNMCFWDDTKLGDPACVSACDQLNSCADYDDINSCNKDVCGLSEVGCVWGVVNNQEICADLCAEVTTCSDYNGKFECKADKCGLHIESDVNDFNKCEYNETNAQCATVPVPFKIII